MPKLSDAKMRRAIHVMVYGPPKGGKTQLVGELAEHGYNISFFDFENGSNTLVNSLSPTAQERVNLFRIPDTKDFPMGIETALKVTKSGVFKICDTHGKVDCPICKKAMSAASWTDFDNTKLGDKDIVVFDSVTQLANSALSHIGVGKDDTWKPDWDDWGRQGNIMDRFLGNIQNAPYHVICISHEVLVDTVDGGGEKIVPIAGTRNFSRNSAKYFDEVVYCQVRNKKHEAASSTTYSMQILTGSRSATKIEDDKERLSLLPIFTNMSIMNHNDKAKVILQGIVSK